jgi:hypothetical protein
MQATRIHAQVTDTNKASRGVMQVGLVTTPQGKPILVEHDGRGYARTGRTGTNIATGLPVHEMATEFDRRVWITADGAQVFEN